MGMSIKNVKMYLQKQKNADYIITEQFNIHGENTYNVHNLKVEEEDGEAMFFDSDDIIEGFEYGVLKHFLIESMMDNPKIKDNVIIIRFSDVEYIKIELV